MLFDSTPKIITNGTDGAVPGWLAEGLGSHADVLLLVDEAGELGLRDAGDTVHPLINPPSAVTLFVPMAAGDADPLFDAASTCWTDAGLAAPHRVDVRDTPEALSEVTQELLGLQGQFVREAARRNVDLLQQIAVLREVTEDQNASFAQAIDMLSDETGGAKMLYRAEAYGPGFEMAPEATLKQRLPLAVHPRLIGGVGCYVTAKEDTLVTLTLWSEELQIELGRHSYEMSEGRALLFLPFTLHDGITPKLLDLIVENNGYAPVSVESALCESPDERAMGESPADFSVRLDLCGKTSGEPRVLPINDWLAHENADNSALEAFVPKTPDHDSRNWFGMASHGKLLVHPLPNATAIASIEKIPLVGELAGVHCTVQLREKATSITFACVSVTEKALSFEDDREANDFASGESAARFQEVARSEWLAILPGTEQDITLKWDRSEGVLRDLKVHLMTSTRGKPTAYNNCWFKSLTFFQRD